MVAAAPPGAVVIAAPASGNGKTTIATGLMAALSATGRVVAPFKVGPDFIDPSFHALATGRPGRNLDANLQGADRIAPLYAHGSRGADIAVVEGVMGLFDGRIGHRAPDGVSGFGSTAHVASTLGAPVLLVVDVRGYSESLGALVRGFVGHATGTRIAGVILNQVGSPRHVEILSAACEAVGVPVVGAVPREVGIAVPSRHLGLLTPDAPHHDARATVGAIGSIIASHVDIDAIAAAATTNVECEPWQPPSGSGASVADEEKPRLAVANGPAFGFRYTEWDECLRAAGAELVFFDPRTDAFPQHVHGLLLPGGYPEEHSAELAANTATREAIRNAVGAGMPVYAECGGLLYLGGALDDQPMVGAIAADFAFGGRLHLGYRDAVTLTASAILPAGRRVVGHEFHRTAMVERAEGAGEPAFAWRGGNDGTTPVFDGVVAKRVHASYLHLHPAGVLEVATGLVDAARNFRLEQ